MREGRRLRNKKGEGVRGGEEEEGVS